MAEIQAQLADFLEELEIVEAEQMLKRKVGLEKRKRKRRKRLMQWWEPVFRQGQGEDAMVEKKRARDEVEKEEEADCVGSKRRRLQTGFGEAVAPKHGPEIPFPQSRDNGDPCRQVTQHRTPKRCCMIGTNSMCGSKC